ncbi:MAG: Aspartate/tyrosine/aromatic aminotransferase [Candidatus Methanohalarchaeum thermophilum]|uniref:Aminotransferase n=1 Tax=Methanohalarchaeum thermophilum TaxID=1903181 RepID=A0A1Q6DWY7_METT1|nr:MAG: Aspartate/tyrosine/aromatic aminotransferase [Candidatus Methanohalarchaeum thermophilum]
MKVSEKVKEVPPSGIREFFDLVLQMDDVVSLGVGEPDFVTPWRIREAGIYSLESGYTSYTSNKGLPELRKLISDELENKYSVKYNPEKEILITSGVSEAYDLAIRSLVEQGDKVAVFEPSYVSYSPCIKFAGGDVVKIDTSFDSGFKPSTDKIKRVLKNRDIKVLVLNNPNNPTGVCLEEEKVREISEICKEEDTSLISDEIYSKLVYDRGYFSPLQVKGMKERSILLDGFSKSYAMTGWRIGYVAGPEHVINAMNKIHQYTMLCAPIMSQKAAVEAIKSKKEIKDMKEEYNRRRKLTLSRLTEMGLKCVEPEGAFYVFPSIKETGLSSKEFAKKLVKEKKVAVVPGTAFGESGEGYIRCSYANSRENLKIAFKRMKEFINEIK